MKPVLEVLSPGGGATIQDLGRRGWKRFGIPPGGAMDEDSARRANLLVGNEGSEPVIELLYTGARLKVLQPAELAITGARVDCNRPRERSFFVEAGEEIAFQHLRAGVWTYLAVQGGFDSPVWFGSASANPRAGLGSVLQKGERLDRRDRPRLSAVSSRVAKEWDSFEETPLLSVWPGPEWRTFSESARARFLESEWKISPESDRTGYRLESAPLGTARIKMLSAPLAVGVIQVPPDGRPIVILRDGPTVGGYPRLAVLDPAFLSRFTQCAPGTPVRFRLIE